ncbi:MAG: tetratricopeptide repeat protein [Gemmatimonas sp.]
MPTRRWYAVLLVVVIAAISLGAVYSIPSIRGWRVLGPFAVRETPARREPPARRTPPPPIARVAATPVPAAAPAPAPVVAPDAANVSPAPRHRAAWVPSERQAMLDRVYLAGKEDRANDAIEALEAWDAKHPNEPETLRELARLLVRNSRPDDGFARYRALLALRPDTSVRAEYAAALLAAQQYDSATANFRILTAIDNESVTYHLGLGRALAWSNHPRDAEPELRWLVARTPGDALLLSMLHLARGAFDPTAAEAARWVTEDPAYAPYRLALARAHVREHHYDLAAAAFDTLLATTPAPKLALVREAASAHSSAGDSIGNARLLGRAVGLSPQDVSLRRSYAEALAWSGNRTGAIAQYDTLIAEHGEPDLFLARARLYAWDGNVALAERDLAASDSLRPSADVWVMVGDLHRWRGEHAAARQAYARANALRPGDRGAAAGLDAIALAEQRDAYSVLRADLGLVPFTSYLGDNDGFSLYTVGVRDGFAAGSRTVVTLDVEARRLGPDNRLPVPTSALNGWAADVGLVQYLGGVRLAADGGIARHEQLGDFGFGSVAAAGSWNRIWTSLELRAGAAYQVLMSAGSLRYTDALVSAAIPLGPATVSAGVDQMWLSDGNSRNSLQFGVRYPLGYGLSAVYAGGMIGFDHGSDSYWDPRRYSSNALGLEFVTHRDSSLTFTARVLPGIGVSADAFSGTPDPANRSAAQLSSGFALDYRRRWLDLRLDGDYAQGVRGSGYHSARARAGVRITP